LPLAVLLIAFGLMWLLEGDRRVATNRCLAAGLVIAIAILLPLERSPTIDLLTDDYDRLSIVHLFLALILVVFWIVVPWAGRHLRQTTAARTIGSGVGAALAAMAIYAVYPKFYGGPMVAVDPVLLAYLISGNADWQSTMPTSVAGFGKFLVYVGLPAICLAWAATGIWRQRHDITLPARLLLALMLLLYVAMSLRSIRFAGFAEIVMLIPLVELIYFVRGKFSQSEALGPSLARAAAACAIILGLPCAGALAITLSATDGPPAAGDACNLHDILPILNNPAGLGTSRHVIAAEIHRGSQIMYLTGHAVVGTPMLRNTGILAIYRLFTAADDATAKAIVETRDIDLILLCPNSSEPSIYESGNHQNTFYNRLIEGRLPGWVHPVAESQTKASGFRLFAVAPAAP
jgi:hypothetical protein